MKVSQHHDGIEVKYYYLETYGCAMNQADSQFMQQGLDNGKLKSIPFPAEADLIILNTCTVRDSTEGRMISRIKKLNRIACETQVPFIVSGCIASAQTELVKKHAPSAITLPPRALGKWDKFVELLSNEQECNIASKCEVSISNTKKRGKNTVSGILDGRTYTIPIAEGCLGSCSYCIVKYARGTLVSFPSELIHLHIKQAIAKGAKEIRLTAQDTGVYGQDQKNNIQPKDNLYNLVEKIIALPETFKIRLGMMNPDGILTDYQRLFELYSSNKLFSFLHLPLQSGSNRILQAMNRKYTDTDFLKITKAFRTAVPESTFATDIIVAFPGETEEDFILTKRILMKTKPEKVHVARYSRRPRTKAAQLPQIPSSVAKQRSRELAELRLKIGFLQNQKRIGKHFSTLITGKSAHGQILGRTQSYRPVVILNSQTSLKDILGDIVDVEIIDAGQVDLKGRIVN